MLNKFNEVELSEADLDKVTGGGVLGHIGSAAGRLTRDYFGYQNHAFRGQSRRSRATWFRP
ncbi:hypothetical protein [Weissella minor]|uniref:Uncharacterized protein n=1 Tax=Weissella minor TaxID=1620 RepID=A0A0R2JSY1_9LACO|nr:hypothetical protein [Weissella minor]KRN78108.1 hypothetical protein IV67_GL001418 [Weissella minor]